MLICLQTEIRGLSSNSSSDVDEWIKHAKRLQEQIAESKTIARGIVEDYEKHQNLAAQEEDKKAKLKLLRHETLFNRTLITSLQDIAALNQSLNEVESGLDPERLLEYASQLAGLEARTKRLPECNARRLSHERLVAIREYITRGLVSKLKSMVRIGKDERSGYCEVESSLERFLVDVLQTLDKLGALDGTVRSLSKEFHRTICRDLLSRPSKLVLTRGSHPPMLRISPKECDKDVLVMVDDIMSLFTFLREDLPVKFGPTMGSILAEDIIDTLISDWLTPSIPMNLSGLQQSRGLQDAVGRLAEYTKSCGWSGHEELSNWVAHLPQIWLSKRRSCSLDNIRQVLRKSPGIGREVEKVERHELSREEKAFAQNGDDDWNADWSDDETEGSTVPGEKSSNHVLGKDSNDAWDWNEDEADEATAETPKKPVQARDRPAKDASQKREVTLTETYNITDIPDHILDIVSREVQDAESLKISTHSILESASAAEALSSLPSLILAMFRAISPAHYASSIPNGNMHLYNDTVYIAEKLRELAKSPSQQGLDQDCQLLEKFSRSAYAREMETQRTILGDLLDGAQGFVNCTRSPYAAECETAISSTVDRLRSVHEGWKPILSQSALMQSTGSLLSTVIEKIVKDVEDMEDISEAESQRLTSFCVQISALEGLFLPGGPTNSSEGGESEPAPLTAVYVANWFRFQYLSNILESSLVDIKYLWTEGELSLEFTAEEVIDLIEALFAESIHRRNAIAEIRRSHS